MSYWGRIIGLGCMAIVCAACSPGGSDGDVDPPPTVYKNYLYVSGGLAAYSIDAATGALTRVTFPYGTWGGSDCLAVHPSSKFLVSGNTDWHQFNVFTIDAATGALTLMDGSPYDVSGGPRALGLIHSGAVIVVANYALPGLVTVCSINSATGNITEVYDYIEYSGAQYRARSLAVHPSDKFVYVACEGLSPGVGEKIDAFAVINAEIGEMAPINDMPRLTAGSAPSFVTVDPSGKYLYLTNQGLDTVSAFDVDATTGALTEVAGSPFSTLGDRPMCVAVDPSGKFAYVYNRSSDFSGDHIIISMFSMDPGTGALTALTGSPHGTGRGDSPVSMAVIRIAYKGL